MTSTGNRKPLYLSGKKDKDILSYVEPLLNKYSFSSIIRELIRDGIKYREQSEAKVIPMQHPIQQPQVASLVTTNPLPKIELKDKELSADDIESRLDNF